MGDPRLFEVARPVADPAAPYIRDLRRFGFTDVLFPGLAGAPPKD